MLVVAAVFCFHTGRTSRYDPVLDRQVTAAVAFAPPATWSVCVRGLDGDVLVSHRADDVLSTASIGKVLLLIEVARQYGSGALTPTEPLRRRPELAVADSGLWQHLLTDTLPVEDLAVLVAGVSDNLATNVLLDRVGLDSVKELANQLHLQHTVLVDRVRDSRGPDDPPLLSRGSADELSRLMSDLAGRRLVSEAVSDRLSHWMSTSVDLSMVLPDAGLDPLSHRSADRGVTALNKTGTDDGVRCDIGVITVATTSMAYAVLANWDPEVSDARNRVLAGMRTIGAGMLAAVARSVV